MSTTRPRTRPHRMRRTAPTTRTTHATGGARASRDSSSRRIAASRSRAVAARGVGSPRRGGADGRFETARPGAAAADERERPRAGLRAQNGPRRRRRGRAAALPRRPLQHDDHPFGARPMEVGPPGRVRARGERELGPRGPPAERKCACLCCSVKQFRRGKNDQKRTWSPSKNRRRRDAAPPRPRAGDPEEARRHRGDDDADKSAETSRGDTPPN